MAALRNTARRDGQSELSDEIHADYLVHPRKKGEEHFRLLPKEHDHAGYVAIVNGKAAPPGRMTEALAYFEQVLVTLGTAELRDVFNVVCQRLEFMCATLEAENAYNIFKSLNSTGVPLGPSDLIRNFVFMHVVPDQHDDFDRDRWGPLEAMFAGVAGRLDEEAFSRFFRDVLMMDGRYVQPKATFSTFELRFEATGFEPAALADALLARAHDYATIAGRSKDASLAVTDALSGLNLLESSTTYPLLLALFRLREEGKIDSMQLAWCIQMLRGFILRRFICNDSSRDYGQTFVRALSRDAGDSVAALETYLLDRGWPDDQRFVEAFIHFPLYKRGYAREVLETLERARGHKEPAALKAAQIEHVMPQTLRPEWMALLGADAANIHAEWLHRPGNLTLSAYNQELGNQPLEQKRERFRQSNIVLTRELGEAATWGPDVIRSRGKAMASVAAALWTGPKEPHLSQVDAEGVEPDGGLHRHELRRRFWIGFLRHLVNTHPDVPAFEARQNKTIRLRSPLTHVGLELRHQLRPSEVAIDVYFWREAVFHIWEKLQVDKADIDALIGDTWSFSRPVADQLPRRMSVTLAAESDDESEWPTLFGWLSQKLAQTYDLVIPFLKAELSEGGSATVSDNEDPAEDSPSATRQQQQRFWGVLAKAMSARSTTLRPQKPQLQHWTAYAIGRSGFAIVPTVNGRDNRIGVELSIGSENAKQQFAALLQQRDAIDIALGFPVEWQELLDRKMSRVLCSRGASPPDDESRWPEYVEWMVERILKMEEVFRPLVRALP